MRIASALGECGRETDGEAFALLLFQVRDLVSSESSPSIDTDWQTAVAELLSHVETLLVTIYLPLDYEIAAASRKSKRMSRDEAFPKVKDFLLTHPNAKREQVAKAVGCSTGMVQQSPAWQRKVAFHKCEKTPLKKIGLTIADEKKSLEVHRQKELEVLQDVQGLDDESDYIRVE